MDMRALVITAALAFATQVNAHDAQVMFWMPNANSCAKILPLEAVQKEYRLTPDDAVKLRQYGMVLGWIQGYVSATNAYHPKSTGNLLPKLNDTDVMNWLFSYCRNEPSAGFIAIFNALNKNVLKIQP